MNGFYFIALLVIVSSISARRRDESVNFDAGTHFRSERIRENGDVDGEYGFRAADGCMHVVRFEVRDSGYRVLGLEKRNCKEGLRKLTSRRKSPKATKRFQPSIPKKVRPSISNIPLPVTKPQRQSFTINTPTTTPKTTKKLSTTTQRSTTTPNTTRKLSTTTPKPTKTTKTPKRKSEKPAPENLIRDKGGKQLVEATGPPEEFLRPSILAPDDPEPEYSFGYETPTHAHTQVGLPGGEKKGKYWYDTPDGWRIIVTYEADERGFRPRVRQIRIPSSTPNKGGRTDGEGSLDGQGEQRNEGHPGTVAETANGCPYYFYTNTKINYHWERCLLNGTRVGEYGKLGSDGYTHIVSYFADARGYHPTIKRQPLTPEQEATVAGFVSGAFIIPKIEEEKQETEKRIQEWIAQNQDKIERPLK